MSYCFKIQYFSFLLQEIFAQLNLMIHVFYTHVYCSIKESTQNIKLIAVSYSLRTYWNQRWNLKNLSRGLNSPKSAKTRFKFSAGLNLETFDMEPTIFKPRLKFKTPLKFFKFGHWSLWAVFVNKNRCISILLMYKEDKSISFW